MKKVSVSFWVFIIFFLCTSETTENGCGSNHQSQKELDQFEIKKVSTDNLMSKQPMTTVSYSMDRYLMDQRNVRFNDPNKMSYLYIVLLDGTWLQVTIIGKLASTSKRLTSPEQVYNNSNSSMGPAPDEMGTYGSSDPARIGMLTLGSLIEFGGFSSYIYSEVPLNFKNKEVIEVQTITLNPQEKQQYLIQLSNLKNAAKK